MGNIGYIFGYGMFFAFCAGGLMGFCIKSWLVNKEHK